MKICPVGAELLRGSGQRDGQTDTMKLTVAFRNFTNTSTKNFFSQIYEHFYEKKNI